SRYRVRAWCLEESGAEWRLRDALGGRERRASFTIVQTTIDSPELAETELAAGFVHLHVHSSYSLLEGALTIARLAELAKADRQPALALTDTDNMFGALEFSEKMAGAGIQPIVGVCFAIDFADQERDPRSTHIRKFPR